MTISAQIIDQRVRRLADERREALAAQVNFGRDEHKRNFPESGVEKMPDAVQVLFDPGLPVSLNDRLAAKIEEVRSLVAGGAIPQVHVILCGNGQPWTADAQQRIDNARLGDQVSWQYVGPEELVGLMASVQRIDDQITLSGDAVVENLGFRRVLIARISAGQLADLFARHGDALLERNIRRYLGTL